MPEQTSTTKNQLENLKKMNEQLSSKLNRIQINNDVYWNALNQYPWNIPLRDELERYMQAKKSHKHLKDNVNGERWHRHLHKKASNA